MCVCFPRHIHCSCSTVMALLCTPVSELVSCTFSTIPICPFLHLLDPRCACAARVTVLGPCVCLSVCPSVQAYFRTTDNEAADKRYQRFQRDKRLQIKMAISLKRRRRRSRNRHFRGPRCVTQSINIHQ